MVPGSTPWQPAADIPPPESEAAAAMQIGLYGEFGRPEPAAGVVAACESLPAADCALVRRDHRQLRAGGSAGPAGGRPAAAGPQPARGFGYFGAPPGTATTPVCVGGDPDRLRARFAVLEPRGRVDTRLGFLGNTTDVVVWKCAQSRTAWSRGWPEWMHM